MNRTGKKQFAKLIVLSANMLDPKAEKKPTEQELESALEQSLKEFVPMNIEEDNDYMFTLSISLLVRLGNKIETLVSLILNLASRTLPKKIESRYALILCSKCVETVRNTQSNPKDTVQAMAIIKKMLSKVDLEVFNQITPGTLTTILKSLIFEFGKKDLFLKESLETLVAFFDVFVSFYRSDLIKICKRLEELKKHRLLGMLMTGMGRLPESPGYKEINPFPKMVMDKIFEAFLFLKDKRYTIWKGVKDSSVACYIRSLFGLAANVELFGWEAMLELLSDLSIYLTGLCFCTEDLSEFTVITPGTKPQIIDKFKNEMVQYKTLLLDQEKMSSLKYLHFLSEKLLDDRAKENIKLKELISFIGFSVQQNSIEPMAVHQEISEMDEIQYEMSDQNDLCYELQLKKGLLAMLKDFLPNDNFDEQIIELKIRLLSKLNTDSLLHEIQVHLDNFLRYFRQLVETGNQQRTVSIKDFENQLKEYSVVQQPLDDIASILIAVYSIMSSACATSPLDEPSEKSEGLRLLESLDDPPTLPQHKSWEESDEEAEDEQKRADNHAEQAAAERMRRVECLEEQLWEVKTVIEQFLLLTNLPNGCRRSYLSAIQLSVMQICTLIKLRQLSRIAPDTVSLAAMNNYLFNLLSTDYSTDLFWNTLNWCFRRAVYSFGLRHSHHGLMSGERIMSIEAFLRAFAPFLNEKMKFFILNNPQDPAALSSVRLLCCLTSYYSRTSHLSSDLYNINTNMLGFLVEVVDHYPLDCPKRAVHRTGVALVRMFAEVLKVYLIDKSLLIEDCKFRFKTTDTTPGNWIRFVALKQFNALATTKDASLYAQFWKNLALVFQSLLFVTSSNEKPSEPFSTNDADNCINENSAGAFLYELWPQVEGQVRSLVASYLYTEDTIGHLVLQFGASRSATRYSFLKGKLRELLQSFGEGLTLDVWLKNIDNVTKLCNLDPKKPTNQLVHLRGLLVEITQFLVLVHTQYSDFYRLADRFTQSLFKSFMLFLLSVELSTIDAIKSTINIVSLTSRLLRVDDPANRQIFAELIPVIDWKSKTCALTHSRHLQLLRDLLTQLTTAEPGI